MSETKFTPGPWTPETQDETWWCKTNHGVRIVSEHHATRFIASVEGMGYVTTANAHLIAAAPALYSALEKVAPHFAVLRQYIGGEALDALERETRTALARARGEQP